jgi:hypothetical protein
MKIRLRKYLLGPWDMLSLICRALGQHSLAGAVMARSARGRRRRLSNGRRTVLISGISRVGKSSVAAVLVARFGYRHLELDRFINHAYAIDDRDARARFRESFYTRLLSGARTGYVIEGDDLVIDDRWHKSRAFGREPLSLAVLSRLGTTFGLPTFVVGAAESSIDAIAASLRLGDSWVLELSQAELLDYARFLRKGSDHLRRMASGTDVIYLEVQTDDFRRTVELSADQIAQAAE